MELRCFLSNIVIWRLPIRTSTLRLVKAQNNFFKGAINIGVHLAPSAHRMPFSKLKIIVNIAILLLFTVMK